jgi:hypothetical protein
MLFGDAVTIVAAASAISSSASTLRWCQNLRRVEEVRGEDSHLCPCNLNKGGGGGNTVCLMRYGIGDISWFYLLYTRGLLSWRISKILVLVPVAEKKIF